jgi:hypothetical protein
MRSIWGIALREGGVIQLSASQLHEQGFIPTGIFVLGTVVHAEEALFAQLGSDIKQQYCLTTLHWVVSAGYTFRYRET